MKILLIIIIITLYFIIGAKIYYFSLIEKGDLTIEDNKDVITVILLWPLVVIGVAISMILILIIKIFKIKY